METELLEDLNEALEGINPMEFLLGDGDLCSVVEELIHAGDFATSFDSGICDSVKEPRLSECKDFSAQNSPAASTSSCDEGSSGSLSDFSSSSEDAIIRPRIQFLCAVCEKPAKGHKYFGAIVCFGCRSFFSRAVKNKMYVNFECKADQVDESCPVETLAACQRCRFDKCVQQGMRAPGLRDREKDNEKSSQQNDIKVVDVGRPAKKLLGKARLFLQLSSNLTGDERLHVENFAFQSFNTSYSSFATLSQNNLNIFRAFLQLVYLGKTVPLKLQKQTLDYLTYVAVKDYMCNMIHHSNLSPKDRMRLAQGNFSIVMEFSEAYRLNKTDTFKTEMESLIDALKKGGSRDFRCTVADYHSQVTKNGKVDPVTACYEHSFDQDELGLTTKEAAERHRLAVKKVSELGKGDEGGSPGEYDPILMLMTVYIILYSPDFLDLDDPAEAERMQMIYITILQKYLKGKMPTRCDQVFRDCILSISYARELSEVKLNAFKRIK